MNPHILWDICCIIITGILVDRACEYQADTQLIGLLISSIFIIFFSGHLAIYHILRS